MLSQDRGARRAHYNAGEHDEDVLSEGLVYGYAQGTLQALAQESGRITERLEKGVGGGLRD